MARWGAASRFAAARPPQHAAFFADSDDCVHLPQFVIKFS
jgi:hypothetical protein